MNNVIKKVLLLLVVGLALATAWRLARRVEAPLTFDMKKAVQTKNIVPIVVIGSGPAGLSAALYAARSAIYTVLFEGKTPGGQLTGTTYVENWPGTPKLLGSQLIDQNRKQAQKFGALLVPDTVTSVNFDQWPFLIKTEEGQELHALAVIIATGAHPKLLNDMGKVKGEKEYWGHGVTTCAICDAPFYKEKAVVVIGGGDSAVEEATLLTSYARSVTMLVRGPALRAAPAMQARLKDSDKIKVLFNTRIDEILGNGSSVTGVRLYNALNKKKEEIAIDGVFLAIGHRPNTELFKRYVKTDEDGYIVLQGPGQRTSQAGVFAAGDVSDHVYRQAGVAAGDGIKAALDAISFLQEHGFNESYAKQLEKNYFDPHPETLLKELDKIVTMNDFDKVAKEHPFFAIEVGAEHCSSCTTLKPVVQSVAAKFEGKAHFVYVDFGDDPEELVQKFAIKGIPALLFFKKGKLIARYDQQSFTKRELYGVVNQLLESE